MPQESPELKPAPAATLITPESSARRPRLIGVGLDARLGLPFDQLRAAAREASELGFESLWTPAGGVPDSFHVCAAWSQDTGLRTGISVVPAARMWTPPGLAAQAATLAQLSGGRFVLGLGTGGYGPGFWASVGLADRPIAVMREYVTQVRALLAGEKVTAGERRRGRHGLARLAPVGVARGRGPAARSGLPGRARPADAPSGGRDRRRRAAQLGHAPAHRRQPGADRRGRRPGGPRTGRGADDDVHPGLHRRRRGRRAAGLRHAGARLRPGPAGHPAGRRLPRAVRPDGVRRGAARAGGPARPGRDPVRARGRRPGQMLQAVGYYGPAAAAPAAFARLSAGLDEAIVRVITARPGLEPVIAAMAALTPALIRAA